MTTVRRLTDLSVEDVEVGIAGLAHHLWGGGSSGVSGVSQVGAAL